MRISEENTIISHVFDHGNLRLASDTRQNDYIELLLRLLHKVSIVGTLCKHLVNKSPKSLILESDVIISVTCVMQLDFNVDGNIYQLIKLKSEKPWRFVELFKIHRLLSSSDSLRNL